MLSIILFYLLLIPLSVLFHELGHGLFMLLFSRDVVRIYLGPINDTNKELFSFGRIRFHLRLSYIGFARFEGAENIQLTSTQKIIISLGGPIASLILACISLLIVLMNNFTGETLSIIRGVAVINFLNFIGAIIPIKYPSWYKAYAGRPSDGYSALMVLRKNK